MIFIPTISAFLNGNSYMGSKGPLRFRVRGVMAGTEGEEHPVLEAVIWYGKACLENSNVDEEQDFDLTDEGRRELIDWLEGKIAEYQAKNS